ncbi:MAG: transposase [Desulfobulbaceae bacterium]|nr:MAG: transposase [Desulfobulbaceae bacterium]
MTLSSRFIEHGVEPVYSDPVHPEQKNGRHERMHRELKGEATRPTAFDLQSQQRKLKSFAFEYKFQPPHSALDLETLITVYVNLRRQYKEKVQDWVHPAHFQVRKACQN